MPRLDDSNSKNKVVTKFKRTPLRPWDSIEEFKSSDPIGTQQEHNTDTIAPSAPLFSTYQSISENIIGTQQGHNRDTIETHQEHIKSTIGTQTEHKKTHKNTIGSQQEHEKEHTKEHYKNTTGSQQEYITDTNVGLSYLTGIQKQILIMLYISCKKTRSHITEEFALINIASALNIRLGSVKTSLRRLEDKGFIRSVTFKKGRGGWTKFELPEKIYREILENDKEHNWNTLRTQQEHNVDTYRNTEKDTIPSSSSSLNINKTTTTDIPEEWEFDISAYALFGFTKVQLKQLISLGLSPLDVEDSLIHFAYDNTHSYLPKILTSKINFLMGLLRRGQKYTSEKYYNEQEKIIQEMAQREQARKRKLEEDRFTVWLANLNDDDEKLLLKPMPANLISAFNTYKNHNRLDMTLKDWLMGYFLKCST